MGQQLSSPCCSRANVSRDEIMEPEGPQKSGFKGKLPASEQEEEDNADKASDEMLRSIDKISDAGVCPVEPNEQEQLRSLGIETATVGHDSAKPAHEAQSSVAAPKALPVGPPVRPPGQALFWTFLKSTYEGHEQVLCLRNHVRMDSQRGLHYIKLSRSKTGLGHTEVKVAQGEGFGQWCRIKDEMRLRLLREYKDISNMQGKSNKDGLPGTREQEKALPHDRPIPDEVANIEYFEDTQDRLPLGLEKGFNISLFELKGEPGKVGPALKNNYSIVGKLPFGLPSSVDPFRTCPLAGNRQASGFVPHINGQQFCMGSEGTFTWVRFDIGDLNTFEHNLQGVPVIRDGEKGIIFPVTHLWVDLDGPAFQWFVGKRCLAVKKMNLWFIPGAVLRGVVQFGMRRLTEVKFEDDEERSGSK